MDDKTIAQEEYVRLVELFFNAVDSVSLVGTFIMYGLLCAYLCLFFKRYRNVHDYWMDQFDKVMPPYENKYRCPRDQLLSRLKKKFQIIVVSFLVYVLFLFMTGMRSKISVAGSLCISCVSILVECFLYCGCRRKCTPLNPSVYGCPCCLAGRVRLCLYRYSYADKNRSLNICPDKEINEHIKEDDTVTACTVLMERIQFNRDLWWVKDLVSINDVGRYQGLSKEALERLNDDFSSLEAVIADWKPVKLRYVRWKRLVAIFLTSVYLVLTTYFVLILFFCVDLLLIAGDRLWMVILGILIPLFVSVAMQAFALVTSKSDDDRFKPSDGLKTLSRRCLNISLMCFLVFVIVYHGRSFSGYSKAPKTVDDVLKETMEGGTQVEDTLLDTTFRLEKTLNPHYHGKALYLPQTQMVQKKGKLKKRFIYTPLVKFDTSDFIGRVRMNDDPLKASKGVISDLISTVKVFHHMNRDLFLVLGFKIADHLVKSGYLGFDSFNGSILGKTLVESPPIPLPFRSPLYLGAPPPPLNKTVEEKAQRANKTSEDRVREEEFKVKRFEKREKTERAEKQRSEESYKRRQKEREESRNWQQLFVEYVYGFIHSQAPSVGFLVVLYSVKTAFSLVLSRFTGGL